ncbi:uncharacterized protein SAMN02927930_00228 [Pseudidiomarina indica]|uniref:Large ribosomal RNA subunit accumulation protein YceD n=1 Tax=Pseudidiomarina indica TaxID=1159017 RepID=A0A1G6AA77_9GAMM|nr:23S rRNA accumulation protein YceD [Pseudidiomarina indica]SDB05200.1 uncharacterized protein SAMN02927930_00228 [Pseudidiomarina indica]
MQKVRVPISVDPVKSAGKQLTYLGIVPGKSLARLQEMLIEPCADVEVSLSFDTDEQGIKRILGSGQVTVQAACERCGEKMALALASDFIYAPITRRQTATEMPEEYEPFEVDEMGEVNLHTLVEDELILAMPVVVKHDERECRVDTHAMQWGDIDETPDVSDNPFAVLQELKRK